MRAAGLFRGTGWQCEGCGLDCTRHVWLCNSCGLRFVSKDKAGNEVSVLGPCPKCCAYRGAQLVCPRSPFPVALVAFIVVAVLVAAAAVGLMHCGGEPFAAGVPDAGPDVQLVVDDAGAVDAVGETQTVETSADAGMLEGSTDGMGESLEASLVLEAGPDAGPDAQLVDDAGAVDAARDASRVTCTGMWPCGSLWPYAAPCQGSGICCSAQVCK